ncbi:pyridine nucleotide-disulfide oxidoreductase domain protein, putative [Rhizoctonia solani AG-3 Rhs1AP]|uniref:Pyridine nucleotide-disulfide oxidoreductase domain protein, putative n=2 Tax=Rhizoctonia solani AG-3 TaxID=1086053 RepID=X8JNJ3_9AGAM|nr:pyridine nucleotide-disulfide oxidoreductase domain protein, putative [Rhizoctonia solani AG-3 Rhs1AP]KEP54989.1 putative pyridine nucleotide-disulfide oxidoreductase domain protein [Rhizoctonia solani 123E]
MKLHQIPVIHSILLRWRPHNDKSASDPALNALADSNSHSPPVRAPPSPKSPSKKSVRISEAGSPPQPTSSIKGKGREVVASPGPAASMPHLPSPPPSPLFSRRSRSGDRCCSGEPVTHPQLGEIYKKCGPVRVHETFECENAVEPVRLLTLTRRRLVNEAQARGGNALVDESWEYTVSKRGKSGYTVKVDYSAGAVLVAGDGAHDSQKPVAIDIAKTKGINGLMMVTSRH